MRIAILCLGALVALAACEPQKAPPVSVMAMVLSNTGTYEPKNVNIGTVTGTPFDAVALRGAAVELRGGARILVDPQDPLLAQATTDDQLLQVFVKSAGGPVKASYVEKDGILWPADFHSWNLVTTYYNFERAFAYFQANGVTVEETVNQDGIGPTAYYFPSFTMTEISTTEMHDNALYFAPIRAFAILPFEQLQTVPLSMNSGVVAHEYSHRVFNRRVYGGQSVPEPFSRWANGITATTPLNVLKSFDEGLADFHAVGASCGGSYGCNPRFLAASLGDAAAGARDISRVAEHCMTSQLKNALNTDQLASFTSQSLDYQVGTILASALYKASYPSKHQVMEQAVLNAYDDARATSQGLHQLVYSNLETPGNFTLAAAAMTLLQHITDPAMKLDACNAFMDHLQIAKADLTAPAGQDVACPAAAAGGTECPSIP